MSAAPRYVIHYMTFSGESRVSEPLLFAGARDLLSSVLLFKGQFTRVEVLS
jgi:hypothetical protein